MMTPDDDREGRSESGPPEPWRRRAFFYVYILHAIKEPERIYVGWTKDLRQRLKEHNWGMSTHTAGYRPWEWSGMKDFRAQDNVAQPASILNIWTRLPAGKCRRASSMTTARKESGRSGNSPIKPRKKCCQVHAGGFLHHLILINEDGSGTAPSQLTNDERKEAHFEHIRGEVQRALSSGGQSNRRLFAGL